MYSLRENTSRVSLNSVRRDSHGRSSGSGSDGDGDAFSEGDDDDDDDYDDEDNDLEMDTLNKNSQGRGGWKMIHTSDGAHPPTPTSATHPASSSGLTFSAGRPSTQPDKAVGSVSKKKMSSFERFDPMEWISMSISSVMVILLCLVAIRICFLD